MATNTLDLTDLPTHYESDILYEYVDGERRELPPMSTPSSDVMTELAGRLRVFGTGHNLGRGFGESLIKLPLPVDRRRRPDACFVPYAVWPKDRKLPPRGAWEVLPSFCAEIVSPTDIAEENRTKVEEYLRAGVQRVWVIYPELEVVDIYDLDGNFRTCRPGDVLDGGPAIPGFALPVVQLFPWLS
jgi:Uma2 family endonuclease